MSEAENLHEARPVVRRRTKSLIPFATIVVSTLIVPIGAAISLESSAISLRLSDPWPDYSIGLLWALVLSFSIALWPVSADHKQALLTLWIARVGVTLGAMLFYEGYYGLDAGFYFAEALREAEPIDLMAFGEGTDNVIGLVALHNSILPESYHATKVTFSFIGLIAVYVLYRAASFYRQQDSVALLYLLGLFPSIMFWSSILGKDPLTLLGIAIYVYGVVRYARLRRADYLLLAVLGIAFTAFIRIWLAAIFVLPLGILLLSGRLKLFGRIVVLAATLAGGAAAIQMSAERFDIASRVDLVNSAESLSQAWVEGGAHGQELQQGFGSVAGMAAFIPVGAFTALFRPLPGEIANVFGVMAGLENALLLIMVIVAVKAGNLHRLREPVIAWIAITIVIWSASYGFVSYQNLGTAFRFKLQVTPLLLLLLLYLIHRPGSHLATHSRVDRA